jgi:hypothetical protein
MSEQPTQEPGSIIIARRALSERKNQCLIGEAWSNLLPQYQQDVEEISAFLADWEAGQISE